MRSARDPLRVGRIATAPGTVHYSPASPGFCSNRFGAAPGNSGGPPPLLRHTDVVRFNRFSGHDLTLLSNDEKA
jgi:hypothetical protein